MRGRYITWLLIIITTIVIIYNSVPQEIKCLLPYMLMAIYLVYSIVVGLTYSIEDDKPEYRILAYTSIVTIITVIVLFVIAKIASLIKIINNWSDKHLSINYDK